MMAPEQLNTYWGHGSGYSHKIDVWAMGVIFYQMLTGMFMFTVDRTTKRQDAMKALYDKIVEGTWSWPSNVMINLTTFDFLNKTMQHDPFHRPTWQEMQEHPIFTASENGRYQQIKLDIIFNEEPQEGIAFRQNKIYVNTKDPTLYEKLHQQAVQAYMEQHDSFMQDCLNSVLVSQDRTLKKYFRPMSQMLKGEE